MPMMFDNIYMQEALKEAEKAYLAGEVPVGCVIVEADSNRIIARAHNMMQALVNPNAHAEMLAIKAACQTLGSKSLASCEIYITLEPCTMCASAIANARIKRLYYSLADEKHGAIEHGVRFFNSDSCFHRPEIYPGFLEQKSLQLMRNFFAKLRNKNL